MIALTQITEKRGKPKLGLAGIGFLLTSFGLLPKLSTKENIIKSFCTEFVCHDKLGFDPN